MAQTPITVDGTDYADCGAGPLALASNSRVRLLVYAGASAPGDDDDSLDVEIRPGHPLNYAFDDNLFVKLKGGNGGSVVLQAIA